MRPVLGAHDDLLPNSISEKVHVVINGTEQGMFLRSTDTTHPVLFFPHGGPAIPRKKWVRMLEAASFDMKFPLPRPTELQDEHTGI